MNRGLACIFALVAIAGCRGGEGSAAGSNSPSGRADTIPEADPGAILGDLPHAGFLRFQQSKGQGLGREVWEIEILQADSDIWIKGAVRSQGKSVPFKETMALAEYHDLWTWIRGLELDKLVAHEDSTKAPGEWRKSLVVDIVETPDRRILAKSEWSRPLLGQPEIHELEKRLNQFLVRSSERELKRMAIEADSAIARERAIADSVSAQGPQ